MIIRKPKTEVGRFAIARMYAVEYQTNTGWKRCTSKLYTRKEAVDICMTLYAKYPNVRYKRITEAQQ